MEKIEIIDEEQIENGWRFVVEVGEGESKTQHSVTLDKEYWEKLTHSLGSLQGPESPSGPRTAGQAEKVPPEELVKKSFEFLLAREPKESILREFNLREIAKYFPEYESEIKV